MRCAQNNLAMAVVRLFTNPSDHLDICSMNVLMWFKRDLRMADHPALALAAARGRVLPVWLAEPDYWRLPDVSARHWAMTTEAVDSLRGDLAAAGLPLVVRMGEAVLVLERLCRAHGITEIVSHEETGNLWTWGRDKRVAAWARAAGIRWTEVPQSGVQRGLAGGRDGFMTAEQVMPHGLTPVPGVEPGAMPSARAMGLADDPCPHRQQSGRARALATLDSFLTSRGAPYRAAMSSPLSGERACSRLSPHLALGVLSLREVVQATAARQAERPSGDWGGSLRSFQARLAWRDHFIQKLEDCPSIETTALQEAGLRVSDAARLAAWEAGATGLPFLDACLRYLRATGWLNFRARAMVMACASYHLWLDWRAAGTVLARRFTDYEPGIHWPQVQMQAGVTGSGAPRIYNPVKQGWEQDPTGAFTRRWLPELAAVPDLYLQEPWRWPGASQLLGRRYPEPVVDPVAAARAARDRIAALRAEAGPAPLPPHRALAEAARASPLSRARQAAPRDLILPSGGRQLSLDL